MTPKRHVVDNERFELSLAACKTAVLPLTLIAHSEASSDSNRASRFAGEIRTKRIETMVGYLRIELSKTEVARVTASLVSQHLTSGESWNRTTRCYLERFSKPLGAQLQTIQNLTPSGRGRIFTSGYPAESKGIEPLA